jgi:hypothetical protein
LNFLKRLAGLEFDARERMDGLFPPSQAFATPSGSIRSTTSSNCGKKGMVAATGAIIWAEFAPEFFR